MKRKKIDVKFYSVKGSSELFSFDKETFDLITNANAELEKMVRDKDLRIAVLERALRNTVESWCIMDNPNNPDDIYNRAIDQAEKELEEKK